MNRLDPTRRKKLIGMLTDPKKRTWMLNRIRREMGTPVPSWTTVRRYAAKYDRFAAERTVGSDGRPSDPHKPLSGAKYKATLIVGTFTEIVRLLRTNGSPEARRLLRKMRTEDPRAYAEALGGAAEVDVATGAGHWPWIDDLSVVDRVAAFLR